MNDCNSVFGHLGKWPLHPYAIPVKKHLVDFSTPDDRLSKSKLKVSGALSVYGSIG